MMQGLVFLKGRGGAGTFTIYLFFLSFLHLEITLCEIALCI